MRKIALYIRTSTSTQSKGLDAQHRALKRYLETQEIDKCRVLLFKDGGYSGRNTKRPHFQAMMEEIEKGNIESVICYSFSRISRSIKDLTSIIEVFEENGVKFHSLSENICTSTPVGRCFLHILASLSTLELEQIRERTINGLQGARERGVQLGRPRTRNSELIQELHKQGLSQRQIAKMIGVSKTTVFRELKEAGLKVAS